MMNQGENAAETVSAEVENHNLRDNGVISNSTYNQDQSSSYNHDQQVDPTLTNTQDGTNPAPVISTSSSGPTNVAQGYSGYAAYPNTDPYGYSGTNYATYYSQYQQQPSHYQHQSSEYQQQPNHYQQQSNPYQQQSNQYQQQSNHYQHQLSQSYSHQVGTYHNTGAAYQPLSSFHNTGSYAGPASYSGTYYNHGNYQTSGNYTNGTYGTQTNLWQGGQYATYGSHQYPNYTPDSNSAYSSTSAVPNSQYQDHYKQWQDYYNQTQTEVSCAPGTENLSSSTASSMNNSVLSGSGGYAASNNQIPATYTSSWRPESSSSELAPVQTCQTSQEPKLANENIYDHSQTDVPVATSGSNPAVYWNNGASTFQNDPSNTVQVPTQRPPEVTPVHDSFQNQPKSSFSQSSTSTYPNSYQALQSHQPSFQTVTQPAESMDSQRVNKLQIPTNPRIASNLPMSLSKDKDNCMNSTAPRLAYIRVPMQKPNEKVLSHEGADSMLKPGVFPKSLRGYVLRALARCKNDLQKAACQLILKEVITKATADGTLHTKDWDTEPLFPMPTTDANNNQDTTFSTPSSVPKSKSPSRRAKSRWEPIQEDKMVASSNISDGTAKYGCWNNKQFSGGKIQNRVNLGSKSSDNRSFGKNVLRPTKRQRLGENFNAAVDAETSSGSDEEQSLTKYSAAAIALADSPEEKRRRENRSKRFDRGHGNRAGKDNPRKKDVRPGNLHARRASDLVLNKNFEEIGSRAVEDIDWDSFTVKGTCQEVEKRYLRLTSAPDPAMVRPEEVLEKALLMVQNSEKNYLYKCDQLKSIRQDLTVQRIRNELTVKVYETHARLAIEFGDLPEYNQCQSQLKTLYAEGIQGCHMEFAAYNLLCVLLHSSNYRDLLSAMSRLSANAKRDVAVEHALAVRRAVTSGNYVMFFRLYKSAPYLNAFLMGLYVEKMRYAAIKCMSRTHRPTVPVSYISQVLGFTNTVSPKSEASDEKEVDEFDECVEWLKAHGACIIKDNSGETLLDTKASVSTLYMPEPEDAVSHGDANLAVDNFFARNPAQA